METPKLIPQLRIAVNNRCQKACFYCRPSGEGSVPQITTLMSLDDIVSFVRTMSEFGITYIKLTGGDPILRPDIVEIVAQIKALPRIRRVDLVTRHPKAGELAADLADAGLDCLNFSLDTLDRNKYLMITGVDELEELLDAIKKSVPYSKSVKINTVVMDGINTGEVMNLIRFCEENQIKTLKLLDLILGIDSSTDSFINRLERFFPNKTINDLYYPLDNFIPVLQDYALSSSITYQPGKLGHPMDTFVMSTGLKVLLKDARKGAWYGDICHGCPFYPCHDALMALRLTADGKLQRCLAREDNLVSIIGSLDNSLGKKDELIKSVLDTYSHAHYEPCPKIQAQKLFPIC